MAQLLGQLARARFCAAPRAARWLGAKGTDPVSLVVLRRPRVARIGRPEAAWMSETGNPMGLGYPFRTTSPRPEARLSESSNRSPLKRPERTTPWVSVVFFGRPSLARRSGCPNRAIGGRPDVRNEYPEAVWVSGADNSLPAPRPHQLPQTQNPPPKRGGQWPTVPPLSGPAAPANAGAPGNPTYRAQALRLMPYPSNGGSGAAYSSPGWGPFDQRSSRVNLGWAPEVLSPNHTGLSLGLERQLTLPVFAIRDMAEIVLTCATRCQAPPQAISC